VAGSIALCDASVSDAVFARLNGALDQIVDQSLKLLTRKWHVHVTRTARISRDERKVDIGGRGG
jgi:hypothetical protein